jgi:hypothetical protein
MGSAVGAAISLVFMVAIDSMKNEDFQVIAIIGLTTTVDSNAVGYLCACPTRAGNAPFFSWLITDIVAPAVEQAQCANGVQVNSDHASA